MAFSNRVSGRMGLFNHLYGFKRDPNWIPPYCGVAERVFDNYLNAPAVIMGEEGDLTIQRVMQIVQDEYAESVLGSLKAF